MRSTLGQSALVTFAALVVIFSAFLCWIVALPASAEDVSSKSGSKLPLMEEIITQPFTVSVISRKYGVFNATINMKNSLNFPERLHGELIPIGQQQIDAKQSRLEHFHLSRALGAEMPPTESDAHPSLVSINIHLDFSGANAGKLSVWSLPFDSMELEQRESDIESGDAGPTATAAFSFRRPSSAMAPSALSDVPEVARQSTGKVALADGSSGTFMIHFFTEHEFSISLNVHDDTIWVHGYTLPNEAIFSRSGRDQPWWHAWALLSITFLVFILQILTSIIDTKRNSKSKGSVAKTISVEAKKNV